MIKASIAAVIVTITAVIVTITAATVKGSDSVVTTTKQKAFLDLKQNQKIFDNTLVSKVRKTGVKRAPEAAAGGGSTMMEVDADGAGGGSTMMEVDADVNDEPPTKTTKNGQKGFFLLEIKVRKTGAKRAPEAAAGGGSIMMEVDADGAGGGSIMMEVDADEQ